MKEEASITSPIIDLVFYFNTLTFYDHLLCSSDKPLTNFSAASNLA
jgi:hypothetical protein